MNYHIALSRKFDLESIARNAAEGKCPNHVIWEISQILKAEIYQPEADLVLPLDRLRGKIISSPEHWALARQLSKQLHENDVIFCTGEDVGIPIATLCGVKPQKPKVIIFFHNINRLRGRVALKLFHLREKIDLFMTSTRTHAEFLQRYLNLPDNRVSVFVEQPTDISFFTPQNSQPKPRPWIASGGLEKRDYRTLALATQEMNVDVKICALSPNATTSKRAFPKILPSNMSCYAYDWQELRQLYRDSDLVVISLFPNNFQAGLSTLFEALACRRPVIITRSPNIIGELIDSGIVTGVNPQDPVELRQAIADLLDHPEKAQAQAEKGYQLSLQRFNHHHYVTAFIQEVTSVTGDRSLTM